MVGVGVGFDTKGAESFVIRGPKDDREPELYKIPDSREGWVESVRRLLDSYFLGITPVVFDYKKIRPEGAPIKGFGGVSSGYKPLEEVHTYVREVLDKNVGSPITITTIVDIMNLIGKCVVAGNVRRTAEIVFGDSESEEYINLKNYKKNPHREHMVGHQTILYLLSWVWITETLLIELTIMENQDLHGYKICKIILV